jgi:hypothetical protein
MLTASQDEQDGDATGHGCSHGRLPLLPILQSVIERSFGMGRVIPSAAWFLIGDLGLRSLYGFRETTVDASRNGTPGLGARILVRSSSEPIRVALYYPDRLVRHLERHDPRTGLDDGNIDAFATLVEELDHLLTLASRAEARRPVTLLELGLHAGVTKYLLVMHFIGRLTGRRRVSDFHRRWARHHLFEKYDQGSGDDAKRYREAARLAGRYVGWLERLGASVRRAELARFHARGLAEHVRFIEQQTG